MLCKRLFFLIMTFCLIAISIVLVRLIDRPDWATGANRVTWIYGDGTPVPKNTDEDWPWPGCRPRDSGLNTLRHDQALWTAYKSSRTFNEKNEGFARIDPSSGIGTVWRFPENVPHIYTVGLAIGPNKEVAIVYWTNGLFKDLALGILDGKQGWVLKPQIIPNSYGGSVLVTSWVSGKLTVIYQCIILDGDEIDSSVSLPEKDSIWKITYDAGKIHTKRLILPDHSAGKGSALVCRAIFRDNAWFLAFESDHDGQLYFLKEDGTFRMAENTGLSCEDLRSNAETAAFGITTVGAPVSLRVQEAMDLTIDGDAKPLPPPLNDSWRPNYSRSWLASGRYGLSRYPVWYTNEEHEGIARRFNGNWLMLYERDSNTGPFFKARLLDAEGNERLSRRIALATSFESEELAYGVPISRKEGGFWLVSQEGAYAAFGEDLRRLDPLPVFQHLRTEGSWRLDENKWIYIMAFLWILAALPVCLFIAFVMARLLLKEIYRGLCWGGAVYLIVACWAMWKILPLLR
jgi:hypothetical protein